MAPFLAPLSPLLARFSGQNGAAVRSISGQRAEGRYRTDYFRGYFRRPGIARERDISATASFVICGNSGFEENLTMTFRLSGSTKQC